MKIGDDPELVAKLTLVSASFSSGESSVAKRPDGNLRPALIGNRRGRGQRGRHSGGRVQPGAVQEQRNVREALHAHGQVRVVSEKLTSDHRDAIIQLHITPWERFVVAALVVHQSNPISLSRSAQVGWPRVAIHVASRFGRTESASWRATMERWSSTVLRSQPPRLDASTIGERIAAAAVRPEPAVASRPVGWSINAWFTGGE